MNTVGRGKLWYALLYGEHKGELAIGITPITSYPLDQYEVVEVLVRHTLGKDPTPTTISALAHAGLLHVSDLKSIELTDGDTPQLELIQEVADSDLLHGDKRLFFVDRTVTLN